MIDALGYSVKFDFVLDPAEQARRPRDVLQLAEALPCHPRPFDSTRDWADIEAMVESRAIDLGVASDRLAEILGDDPRIDRLRTLRAH